jgi:hypothetical protein
MIEVTYIDHMGSDLSVVNAARVSFNKKSKWGGLPMEKKLNEAALHLFMYVLQSLLHVS